MPSTLSLSLVLSLALPTLVAAAPALTPESYLAYVPNLGGNVTFAVLYLLAAVSLWYWSLKTGKWGLVLPIAVTFESLGWWIRVAMRPEGNQANRALYICYYLFLVVAPSGFLAFNYLTYGRIISAVDTDLHARQGLTAKSRYSFIPPRLTARIFIISDICTFILQAAGGGLQTGDDLENTRLGDKLFLAGVSGQGASYFLFSALTIVAYVRLCREDRAYLPQNCLQNKTARLFVLLGISSMGIIWRSIYRIIEMNQGYGGQLYSGEVYTFTLDGLPLIIAVGVHAIWYPAPMINATAADAQARADSSLDASTDTSPATMDAEKGAVTPASAYEEGRESESKA